MSWIQKLLTGSSTSVEDVQPQQEERFPQETYGPGFPIVLRQDELDDFFTLLEIERDAPDAWDKDPFLNREYFEQMIDDATSDLPGERTTTENRRNDVREILDCWQRQLTSREDAVWSTVGIDYRLGSYIGYCEIRDENDDDEFEEPPELNTARKIHTRVKTASGLDSKVGIVHKRDLPLQEPSEADGDVEQNA